MAFPEACHLVFSPGRVAEFCSEALINLYSQMFTEFVYPRAEYISSVYVHTCMHVYAYVHTANIYLNKLCSVQVLIKQGELMKLSRKEMQPRMFFLVSLQLSLIAPEVYLLCAVG